MNNSSNEARRDERNEGFVAEVVKSARVVAVLGMKGESDRGAPAYYVPAQMQAMGIRVIPVNPTIESALGEKARGNLAEITEPIDIVQVFRRPELIPKVADAILALPEAQRPKVVWLQSGIVHEAAAARLREAGMDVISDRCFAVDASRFRRAQR